MATDMEQTLSASLIPEQRQQAEAVLNNVRANNPSLFITQLVEVLAQGSDVNAKNMAGVLLRQMVVPSKDDNHFLSLDSVTQNQVKQALLSTLAAANHTRPVNNSVAEVVGCLGSFLLPKNEWPNLLPDLLNMCGSDNSLHTEAFLRVLNNLAEYSFDSLRGALPDIKNLLEQSLKSNNSYIKKSSFEATSSVIAELKPGEELELFRPLLKYYFEGLAQATQNKDELLMKSACDTLNEAAKFQPTFFRNDLQAVVTCIQQIVSSDGIDWEIRRNSTEILITLAENGAAMVRQSSMFCSTAVPLVLNFLTLYDDDIDFNDNTGDNDQDNIFFGQTGIQTLSECLGAKVFLTHAFPIIQNWVGSANWKHRYAACNALVFCLSTCKSEISSQDIMGIAQQLVNDTRVEVVFQAFDLLKMTIEQEPETKGVHTESIWNCILHHLAQDNQHWRIRRQCCRLTILTCHELDREHILNYAEPLLQQFGQLISQFDYEQLRSMEVDVARSHPSCFLQEDSLVAVASIAECLGDLFENFYDSFMPILKNLLQQYTTDVRFSSLLGVALDTIGICGLASGPKFVQDGLALMKTLFENEEQFDDDVQPNVMAFYARIANIMGEEFSPYLQRIVPGLLEAVSTQGGTLVPASEPDPVTDQRLLTIQVHLRGQGDYKLLLNPIIMAKQGAAANMLFTYAELLPMAFWPWVGPTVEAMKPLMTYAYDTNVRVAAIGILTPLIRSCRTAMEQGKASKNDLQALFNELYEPFMKAVCMEPNTEEKDCTLECVNDTLDAYKLPLTIEQQKNLANFLLELLKDMIERREEHMKVREEPDFDEQAQLELLENLEVEDGFLQSIVLCNKRIAQLCGGSYVRVFEEILGDMIRSLFRRSAGEICWALALFDDLIELAKPEAVNAYAAYMQTVMKQLESSQDEYIMQNVAYAIHVLLGAEALTDLQFWTQWLTNNIQKTHNHKSKTAVENCTSALGILMLRKSNQLPVAELLPFWISHLPIEEDEEEVETSTKTLCSLAQTHPGIISAHKQKVTFALVASMGSGALTAETAMAAVNLLQCIVTDQNELQSAIMNLPAEHMQVVVNLLQNVGNQI